MDDAPTATDHDERALEAIRRELDRGFPQAARGIVFAWHVTPEAERAPAALPASARPRRHRRAIVVGALLLAFVTGGAAGALIMTFVSREPVTPAVDRDAPGPTPTPVTSPLAPVPASENTFTPTPRPTAPTRRASPPERVATPAPAAEPVVPDAPVIGGAAATAGPIVEPLRRPPESP